MAFFRSNAKEGADTSVSCRLQEALMSLPQPPVAERRASFHFSRRHHRRPLGWLRDPGYPNVTDEDVLDYLKAENAYFEAAFGEPQKALVDRLFEEMKGRIKEDLSSVPLADGPRILVGLPAGRRSTASGSAGN